MTKQIKKTTLADKKAAKEAAVQAAKPVKEVKGMIPNFDRNQDRAEAHQEQKQALAAKAKAETKKILAEQEQNRLKEMVIGTHGSYHVFGRNSDDQFVTNDFIVTLRWFPKNGDKPAQDILVIQEPFLRDGAHERIFIPHTWLLQKHVKANFTRGKIGEVQDGMLAFLQHNLKELITKAKARNVQKNFMKMTRDSFDQPMDAVITMKMVDEEHKAEFGDDDDVKVPVSGIDVSSMFQVDQVDFEQREMASA